MVGINRARVSLLQCHLVAKRPNLFQYHLVLDKSLGSRIDSLFAQVIELVAGAMFAPKMTRLPIIDQAIRKNDVLKFMLYVLLELDAITPKQFAALGGQLEEVGRMLYGWRGQLAKQNHPAGEQGGTTAK